MHVIDLEGNEYPLQATTTNNNEVNGNQFLSSKIVSNKVNDAFINDISEMWNVIDHDSVEHKIVYAKKQGSGNRLSVDIKAIPLFFDVLKRQRIYERIDKHMTANEAFTYIFNDTGFTFVLVDSFAAVDWEGFGEGEEKLSTYKRALERYKAEFEISGRTVYLKKLIGRDTDIMYRHKLNASNIVQEIDANEMWTYARGYGDYGDGEGGEGWQNAKLIREYTSPLANIVGIGIRHAPPIKNGNITDKDFMDEQLKTLVDESLKISVSATIHDLRKQNYPIAQSKAGDRVFLVDERIGLNEEVRVVAQSVARDWKGNIIDFQITFGTPGLSKRHQSKINEGIKRIDDIVNGREQLPYNVLPPAVKRASEALLSAMTELDFANGIIARDPTDPNRLVLYNSAGLGISLDGGQTFEEAITYLGINTKLLTAGDIHTNHIRIIGEDNYFFWDGSSLQAINPDDVRKYVKLTSDGLYVAKGALTIERPDGAIFVQNGIPNLNYNVQGSTPSFKSAGVEIANQWARTDSTTNLNIDMFSFRHEGKRLKFAIAHRMDTEGSSSGAVTLIGLGRWANIINTSFVFSNSAEDGSEYHTFTVDLGVPTYQEVNFYYQIRTGAQNRRAYTRKLRVWQEG